MVFYGGEGGSWREGREGTGTGSGTALVSSSTSFVCNFFQYFAIESENHLLCGSMLKNDNLRER